MTRRIVLTGGLGVLGSKLVPRLVERGDRVTLIVRDGKLPARERVEQKFPKLYRSLEVVAGDILDDNLAFGRPLEADSLWHCAASVELGEKRSEETWKTNVDGTRNMMFLADKLDIPKCTLMSTAYTEGRNSYERSKGEAENLARRICDNYGIQLTVLKPSIIIGNPEDPTPLQGITLVAKALLMAHKKVEAIRRHIQDFMLMPVIEPIFRLKGDPEAHLNIIPVDTVATYTLVYADGAHGTPGTSIWLTNPNPPTVQQVATEMGEALNATVRIEQAFKPSLIERVIARELAPLAPYLSHDQVFPCDIPSDYRIPDGYVARIIRESFNGDIS